MNNLKISTDWTEIKSNPVCDFCKGVNGNRAPSICIYNKSDLDEKIKCIKYLGE